MARLLRSVSSWAQKQAKTAGTLAAGIIIGSAGSAVVLASIPDANGVIHGCIRNNGDLRIIDDATEACSGAQTPINFNQTGPQGPAGPQGPTGPQGPAGSGGVGAFLDLVGAHFTGSSNLQYRDFAGVDFHDAFLENVNFSGSDLHGANFTNVRFDGGELVGVDASDTIFVSAQFNASRPVNNSNFQGADFSGASINHFSGENADFRNTNFSNVVIDGGFGALTFEGVDFSSVTFTEGAIIGFDGTNFQGANLTGRTFGRVSFNGANLTNANLSNTTYEAANGGEGAHFINGTTASNTNFSGAEFNFTNFTGTDLSTATLSGVTWNNVICPDGTNSADHGDTCAGHLVP